MKEEVIKTAKTVEEAKRLAAEELNVTVDELEYEVLEEAKRGFLGMGASPAKIRATYIFKPLEAARNFAETLIKNMGINAIVTIHDDGNGEALLTVSGEDAGLLIGHHGDTLDSLQYLVNLAANKKESDERKYTRISVDIENYREKREETLKKLARRMAEKVKRTGNNVVLEPMNAYERRIIHSEIQNIEGVSTNSVGAEGNRRVILFPEGNEKPVSASRYEKDRKNGRKEKSRPAKRTRSHSASKEEDAPAERVEKKSDYTPRPRRTSDTPRPAPRKIEKAKDLDSYFAKLKEFGSSINATSVNTSSDDEN
ncbi:MAG: RNA-binding cell elongation regulator Jag/EloR [Eubacteriales bacterium]